MFIHCVLIALLPSSVLPVDGFKIKLLHDGPILIGGTIHFVAEVREGLYNDFRYEWKDNATSKQHSDKIVGNTKCEWNVTYTKGEYDPGIYEVELNVCENNYITYWPCETMKVSFDVTSDLNGKLEVLQNNTVKGSYVSNSTEVEHKVVLKESDASFLKANNFTVITFWFFNCTYLGMAPDLSFRFNYTTADEDVTVKAILVAAKLNETTNSTDPSVTPLTNVTSNTTSTPEKNESAPINDKKSINSTDNHHANITNDVEKSLNSTVHNNGTYNTSGKMLESNLNITTVKPKTTNSTLEKQKTLNASLEKKKIFMEAFEKEKILTLPFKKDNYLIPWPDGSCNGSFIPKDPDKLYGYFHHVVKPRRPVQVLNVIGNNWLKNGDLLNLTVVFTGSPPYRHCIQFISGEYNTTGNESCLNSQKTTTNKINVIHYFGSGDKHTVLFIIGNTVSKTVTAVVVTNYIAKKHPQLSVVIVPVTFIAIAVILIVFGVAYYIQSINRGHIEVADFDFSANNDMEYRSFKERLHEALSSAFTRSNLDEEPEEGPAWSPSRNTPNKPRMFSNPSDSE